jgi:phosphoribosylformylglycinamidine cyclo-ligase
VARDRLIDGTRIRPGDVLIGLPSSGLHTNGYSLARRIVFDTAGLKVDSQVPALGGTVGEALLAPHRTYLPLVRPLLGQGVVKGMAHITGGGITENLPRILPEGRSAAIDRRAWDVPPLFHWLQQQGGVPDADMLRTFNMGIGLIIACASEDADRILERVGGLGEPNARVIGEIRSGRQSVEYV